MNNFLISLALNTIPSRHTPQPSAAPSAAPSTSGIPSLHPSYPASVSSNPSSTPPTTSPAPTNTLDIVDPVDNGDFSANTTAQTDASATSSTNSNVAVDLDNDYDTFMLFDDDLLGKRRTLRGSSSQETRRVSDSNLC